MKLLPVFLIWLSVLPALSEPSDWSRNLIAAAKEQVGTTVIYDGAYVRLEYPMGDIARGRGVCTDVVVRALRDAHRLDLQELIHQDMKVNFSAYPKIWGLKRPDSNIDHRRVPNIQVFFKRRGISLPVSSDAAQYQPGDLVTWMLPGNLPHIGIVTEVRSRDGMRPMIVHNIGAGTQVTDILFKYDITGHYRPNAASF